VSVAKTQVGLHDAKPAYEERNREERSAVGLWRSCAHPADAAHTRVCGDEIIAGGAVGVLSFAMWGAACSQIREFAKCSPRVQNYPITSWQKGDQMGDDLAFKVGVIGLGFLSSTLLTLAVFSFWPPEAASVGGLFVLTQINPIVAT
jgi:hypothetical protein